ncbi:MAG: tetratricopeptide repeat protein [Thermodesulfobacteriota bacterium]
MLNHHLTVTPSPVSGFGRVLRLLPAVIILAALALVTYANTFTAPFVFDDLPHITENPCIRVSEITPGAMIRILDSRLITRPLANFSLAVNFFFHQYDVRGYHAVNLAIHIITALLVMLVARETLRLGGYDTTWTPLLAAALWLVNPVHTQSVTYIVQRMNSMAALFYLLALYLYIRARMNAGSSQGRSILLYALCLTAAVLALASKENAATLIVVLPLYEWFFFYRPGTARPKHWLFGTELAAAFLIALAILYLGLNPDMLHGRFNRLGFTMGQRLLTEAGVVIYYVSLIFFPHPARLNLDPDFPLSRAMTAPLSTFPAMIALGLMLAAALYGARRHRLCSFAALWFLITLSIESSVLPLALIYEHRTYLPSVFPLIALTAFADRHIRPQFAAVVLLSLCIGVCGFWTYRRNAVWTDAIRLWQDTAAKSPGQARPYCNIGSELLLAGKPGEAIAPLARGLVLDPYYTDIHNAMAIACHLTGNDEKALAHCRAALDTDPGHLEALNTMGFILREQGNLDQARERFDRVLEQTPDNFEALMNLGLIERARKDIPGAVSWFQKAVAIHPANDQALYYLSSSLAQSGRTDEAIEYLQKARKLSPNDPALIWEMVLIFSEAGNYGKAAEWMETLVALQAGNPKLLYNLACLYALQHDRSRAVETLRKAVDGGYNDWPRLRTDKDLENIRGTTYYQNLIQNH